jgi:hypothetical protein
MNFIPAEGIYEWMACRFRGKGRTQTGDLQHSDMHRSARA